jgi:6-phosphogluconolactonase
VHGDLGEVSAFRIDPASHEISFINKQDCGGRNPVHLTPDLTNRFMLVANYATGTLGALPINADGSLGVLSDTAKIPGEPGPHKTQQRGIYPHQIPFAPGNRFLIVPDKGGDKVTVFRFDPATGKFTPTDPPSVKAREGAGPRHIAFHPTLPVAYLVNELDSTIATYAWDGAAGTLNGMQWLPGIPAEFMGDNTSAGIAVAPSGRFVFMSNRGHDSIVTYATDPATGLLSAPRWTPTQGKQPRFFTLDPSGAFLYAANENSDSIVTFTVDATSGGLTPTGQVVKFGSPTCVVFRSA